MDLYNEVIRRFQKLFARAGKSGLQDPTAVALATASKKSFPSIRTVLLKGADEHGFVFYTNSHSRKGKDLLANPNAALCFHWQPLKEQVIVEGRVESVSPEEADAYWVTRPRLSQIGAWASLQSQPMKGYKHLLGRVALFEMKFAGRKVPRPPHWSGFRVIPRRIEFWKEHRFRLHERVEYRKTRTGWRARMLFP